MLWQEAPEYEQNFSMVMRVLEYAEVKEEDEEYVSPLDLLFQAIEREKPVMDLKYDLMKHPAIGHTIDGGGPPYIHHQKKPNNWLTGTALFAPEADTETEEIEHEPSEKQ